MAYILVWLNMIELQIKSSNIWLKTLLTQYFDDLKISAEADISILEDKSSFHINSTLLKQNWHIIKPASFFSLINIINQAKQIAAKNLIMIGPVSFYPSKRLCVFNDEEIILTQKETEILLYLTEHPQNIAKATLLEAIWGYCENISTNTLETHIYKLRNKFAGKYEIILSNEDGYALQIV